MKNEWWKNDVRSTIKEVLEGQIISTDITNQLKKDIDSAILATTKLRNEIKGENNNKYTEQEKRLAEYFKTISLETRQIKIIIEGMQMDDVDPDNIINILEVEENSFYYLEAGEIVVPTGNTNGHKYTIGKLYEMIDYEIAKDYKGKQLDDCPIMNNDIGSVRAATDEEVAIFITRRNLVEFDAELHDDPYFNSIPI